MKTAIDIAMEPVEGSSNVAATGHDAGTKTMRIEFRNGGCYDCSPVTAEAHTALRAAESVGGHFHKHIRSSKKIKIAKVE